MQNIKPMPKEKGLENGLDVLREGYLYVPNRLKTYQSNAVKTRLMGQEAILIGGEEAAKLFYDEEKFKREGAAPEPAVATLLGKGGVQQLDGEAHRQRKRLFLELMSKDRIEIWAKMVEKYLYIATKEWIRKDSINFYEESQKVLTRAACEWCGVPLKDKEIKKRTKQLISMIESPVAVSKRHIEGRIGRKKGEKWISGLIEQVRKGELHPGKETALYRIAWHRELNDQLLDLKTASVELLNVIRPSVAIALYFSFTALTLHQFPEEKEKLTGSNPYYLHMFIQEIRRYYPFFPFNGAITRKEFIWNDYQFEKDTLTIFDFYGTNHDPRVWEDPEQFRAERFKNWHKSPTDQIQFKLLAQGGGSYAQGHRCPGEWNTVRAMEVVTDFLINKIDYRVPDQDTHVSLQSMPTIPESGMIFEQVLYKGQ